MRGGRREEREVGDRAGGGSRREFRLRGGRSHRLGGCREADRREKKGREGEEFWQKRNPTGVGFGEGGSSSGFGGGVNGNDDRVRQGC